MYKGEQFSIQEHDEDTVGITQSENILCGRDTNLKTLHNSNFTYFNTDFTIKINLQ